MQGKPTMERCRQDSGCSLGTTGLVGALVWRDSPMCVSVDSAAVIGGDEGNMVHLEFYRSVN